MRIVPNNLATDSKQEMPSQQLKSAKNGPKRDLLLDQIEILVILT